MKRKTNGFWYPNDIKSEDVNKLKEWQLLVALIHFSKPMRDCVDLNYGYKMHPKYVGKDEIGKIRIDQTDMYGSYIDITESVNIEETELLDELGDYRMRLYHLKNAIENDWKRLGKLQLR